MKRWKKWPVLGLVLLILPLMLALLVGAASAHLRLNFCRELISFGDGYAGIEEDRIVTTIFQTGRDGAIAGQVWALSLDFLTPQVKSFEQLFQDEDGTLYVSATLHGEQRYEDVIIYQVDFQRQLLTSVWTIQQDALDGSLLDGQRFTVMGGVLYFTIIDRDSMRLVTYSMEPGASPQPVSVVDCRSCAPTACVYTPEGLATLYRDQGVFLQDQQLYPLEDSDAVVLGELGWDDGTLSFLDLVQGQIKQIDLNTRGVSQAADAIRAVSGLENVHLTGDGVLTACTRQDGALVGLYWAGGSVQTLSELWGPVQWSWVLLCFAAALLIELAIGIILALLLIWERRGRTGSQRHFLSVRARISILSVGVVLVCTAVVAVLLIGSMDSYSRQRQQINAANAAGVMVGQAAQSLYLTGQTGKTMDFSDEFLTSLYQWSRQQSNSDSLYDYRLFAYHEEWYCVYSPDQVAPVPAKYVADAQTIQYCQAAYDSTVIQSFRQSTSRGIQNCTIAPKVQNWARIVSMVIRDDYDQRTEILSTTVNLIQVSAAVCVALLLAENILIWLSMRRLTRLNRELAGSESEWNITDFPGEDEISETSQAMKVMTGSIEQSMNQMRISNTRYEQLIPKDAIRLMGADSFVQVHAGQMVTQEAFLLLLSFHQAADSWIQTGIQAVRDCGGLLLNFDRSKITCCFLQKNQLAEGIGKLLRHPALAGHVTLFFSPGTLQVGVVGNQAVKRVLVLSQRGKQLRHLSNQMPGQGHLGFCFDPDVLDLPHLLEGYAVRLAGWQEELPYYEVIAAGADVPQYAEKESFEWTLREYHQGRYQQSLSVFQRIHTEHDGDTLAAFYDESCKRHTEESRT